MVIKDLMTGSHLAHIWLTSQSELNPTITSLYHAIRNSYHAIRNPYWKLTLPYRAITCHYRNNMNLEITAWLSGAGLFLGFFMEGATGTDSVLISKQKGRKIEHFNNWGLLWLLLHVFHVLLHSSIWSRTYNMWYVFCLFLCCFAEFSYLCSH